MKATLRFLPAIVFCWTSTLFAGSLEEPIEITGPTVIDAPGHYVLTGDIESSDADVFISIESNDVLLDGQGHRIGGQEKEDSIAIRAKVEGSLSGVTIRNVVAEDWQTGFSLSGLVAAEVEGNTARRCSEGFRVQAFPLESHSNFTGNSATDGDTGFYFSSVRNTNFSANTAENNSDDGFRFILGSDLVLTNNAARYNGRDGFHIGDERAVLTENQSQGNGRYGLALRLSSGITLRDNQLSGNRFNLTVSVSAYADDFDIDDSNTVEGAPVVFIHKANGIDLTFSEAPGYLAILDSTDVTVQGLDLHAPNGEGILVRQSEGCTLSGLDVRNSESGVQLIQSENITLRDVVMDENRYNLDIVGKYSHDIDSSNTVNGKPVLYLRGAEAVTIDENDDPGYLGIIGSRDISVSGLSISGNGQGILVADSEAVEIVDVETADNRTGISFQSVQNSRIENFRAPRNSTGILLYESHDNSISNGKVEPAANVGLHLRRSDRNRVQNISTETTEFSAVAVSVDNSARNVLEDSVFTAPAGRFAISMSRATANVLRSNRIYGSLAFSWYVERNLFYDNWLETGGDFVRDIDPLPNSWNVEPAPGPNIAGGPVVAGNFWARPDGTGPSQTCEHQTDGLCDEPFVLSGTNNIDEIPLAIPDFELISISEPTIIEEPGYYVLDRNWDPLTEGPFIHVKSSGVTLDGLGHSLHGDGGPAIVVGDEGTTVTDVRVRNFELEGWAEGIRLNNVHNSRITGNEIFNTGRALVLQTSTGNQIYTNHFLTNGAAISLDSGSSDNRIFDNEFIEDTSVEVPANAPVNIWYTEPVEKTNVAGGPLMGGNFWGRPDGEGHSQTCFAIEDGLCVHGREVILAGC